MSGRERATEMGADGFSAEGALALRAWALGVLAGGASGWRDAPAATTATWRAFLDAEDCALPLRERLGPPAPGDLPEGAAAVVDEWSTGEQLRMLSARAQALQLGRWAAEQGVRLVVLKGGLAAVEGRPQVGMVDLDVLLPPEQVAPLAARMDAEWGYRRTGLRGTDRLGDHIRQRLQDGGVRVEVHRAVGEMGDPALLLAAAVPLPGAPGAWRLSPVDHLWHVLAHAVVSHPERRGRLRDVVLLADAWARADEGARTEVRRRARAHGDAALLAPMLEMSAAAAGGTSHADPFRAEAAARCLLVRHVAPAGLPRRLARDLSAATFALLAGSGAYRACWARALGTPPSAILHRRGRLLAGAARLPAVVYRAGRLTAASVLAVRYARRARAAARASA